MSSGTTTYVSANDVIAAGFDGNPQAKKWRRRGFVRSRDGRNLSAEDAKDAKIESNSALNHCENPENMSFLLLEINLL
jgi:hypothetical protein